MKRYYFVGLGKKESYTTETLRALGKAFKTLQAKVQDGDLTRFFRNREIGCD